MFELRKTIVWASVVTATALVLGCGGGDKPRNGPPDGSVPDGSVRDGSVPDGPLSDGPLPDGPTSMDVHGTATAHFITDTGVVDRPDDLSRATVTSFVPTASGFERRVGTAAADGTFVLPVGLGALEWQLELVFGPGVRPLFLIGNSTHPDLSFFSLGRPDQALPVAGVLVTVNATGLAPWQATDLLLITSSNAGAIDVPATNVPPTVGDTAIVGKTISWDDSLIDLAKGDTATMVQLATKTSTTDDSFYLALAKSGPATGLSMVDGQPTSMTVALANVPQSKTLAVHVQRSQFDALRAQVGPGALPADTFDQSIRIEALPDAVRRGFFQSGPLLVEAFPPTGTLDFDQTFHYGNPFATATVPWDEFAKIDYFFVVPVLARGATTPDNVTVGFTAEVPVAALAVDGTIAPAITPVRNVKIAGMDLGLPRSGVGLTPTLTWDAPATGTPTDYRISLRQVTATGGVTTVQEIAEFRTTSTSLQLPSTILVDGATYMLVINANVVPGSNAVAVPFIATGLSHFHAASATAQFTP